MSENIVSPAADSAAAKPSRRWPALLLGLGLAAVVAGGVGWFLHKPKTPAPVLASDKLGMSRPDGLLETRSLSQLPKDLLAVPFLKETLTEDFVF